MQTSGCLVTGVYSVLRFESKPIMQILWVGNNLQKVTFKEG